VTLQKTRFGHMIAEQRVTCNYCNGSGKQNSPQSSCETCLGHKRISENKILIVEIDKGTPNGIQLI